MKRPSISKAALNSTVYNGFRWALIDRNMDSTIVNLAPTKITKIQNIGYIAKINNNKTEILNVYLDRKTASRLNGCKNIDNVVKHFKCSNAYYYKLYHLCDKELITNFENKYGLVVLYANGVGMFSLDNLLLKEFTCKNKCSIQVGITNKTLTKALLTGKSYKYLDPKIKMID
jgi:hypothetical protein